MQSVSILCTEPTHPVNPWLERWAQEVEGVARVSIFRDLRELTGGDLLFLISCHQIIKRPTRELFGHTLVLHASALPEGRGMSPHIWQILEGRTAITMSLLNAEDALDSGDIWRQVTVPIPATALHEEINQLIFKAEVDLMSWALHNVGLTKPRPQVGTATYYRKRTPADSELDVSKPLSELFDQLRVADPDRYPAFFNMRGQTFRVRIERK